MRNILPDTDKSFRRSPVGRYLSAEPWKLFEAVAVEQVRPTDFTKEKRTSEPMHQRIEPKLHPRKSQAVPAVAEPNKLYKQLQKKIRLLPTIPVRTT